MSRSHCVNFATWIICSRGTKYLESICFEVIGSPDVVALESSGFFLECLVQTYALLFNKSFVFQ